MNPISILLVDDAPETLEVIAMCLTGLGHEVTTASGGTQAIELMGERTFDVVITDVLMPDQDGLQVIMATRRLQCGTPVIAMTGGGEFFAARQLLTLAGKLGADAQLAKPFTQSQLLGALQSVATPTAELADVA